MSASARATAKSAAPVPWKVPWWRASSSSHAATAYLAFDSSSEVRIAPAPSGKRITRMPATSSTSKARRAGW